MNITFEDLPENDVGITMSTRQTAYYEKQYIDGGYLANYQFDIIYRVLPTDDDDRLDAVEVLDAIGEWCEENKPTDINVKQIRVTTNAGIQTAYEDGTKDYSITIEIKWEVFK